MNELSEKTFELVERWKHSKNLVKRLKKELNSAECEHANASNELAKWMVPEGQNNEPFNLWVGSGILQATRKPSGSYDVIWRKEPDGKDALKYGT